MNVDLLVIGGGSAGFAAANAGVQAGARVALAEPDALGGTCLNRGCIPKKALVRTAELVRLAREMVEFGVRVGEPQVDWDRTVARKDRIVHSFRAENAQSLRDKGVQWIHKPVWFRDARTLETEDQEIHAGKTVIATGSRPLIPEIPGVEHAIDSAGLLNLRGIPRRLLIVGGGVIAMEFASIFGQVGSRVTVVEARPTILDDIDPDLRTAIEGASAAWSVEILTSSKATRIDRVMQGLSVTVETKEGEQRHEADVVLIAVGRGPNVEGLNLKGVGVQVGPKGIHVDATLETDVPGVYAAGDVHGRYQLTPISHYEGELAARNALLGSRKKADYRVVPRTVFTIPSASSVGLDEEEARELGVDFLASTLPYGESGPAVISGKARGFVKILFDRESHEIVGTHIFGDDSEELIHIPAVAMKARMKAEELGNLITIHPSLAEAFFSAAGRAEFGRMKATSSRRAS
jgi:dihydrolipoyl dehydrogenase